MDVKGHLWRPAEEGSWQRLALAGEAVEIAGRSVQLLAAPAGWLLMAQPEAALRLNGIVLPGSIRLLQDKDEIAIGGERMYFSTEEFTVVAPHQGESLICPRDKTPVKAGDLAVRCPGCGAVHHQSAELPCWLYADTCSLCEQPTALDAGLRWTPEDL
jgi:hypothetical protein